MKIMFSIFLLSTVLSVFSQEQKVYFDVAISEHLKKYNKQCDVAIENHNLKYVEILFDSLNQTYLKGTHISNLRLKRISGGYLETEKIDLPILLISKKSCFVTHREEIKAINEMANQYKGKLEFVILYWDKKTLAKKATFGYNKNVNLVYINERDNKLDATLSNIKNSFGVPASFYITKNKQLSNIDRKFYLKNIKKSTKKEFIENTYNSITELLLQNETQTNQNVLSQTDH